MKRLSISLLILVLIVTVAFYNCSKDKPKPMPIEPTTENSEEDTSKDNGDTGRNTNTGDDSGGDTIRPNIGGNIVVSPPSSPVSGTITILVEDVTDNVKVDYVLLEFFQYPWYGMESILLKDYSSPYSFSIDTTQIFNGQYIAEATAFDTSGNKSSTPGIFIQVSN